MSRGKLCILFPTVLLFAIFSISMVSGSPSSEREAAISAISLGEQSMVQAYEAVLDAESVGADVGDLLVRLNNAAGLLSEARMDFEVDNFEEAARFAELSSEIGDEALNEAEKLETDAKNARVSRASWFMGVSVFGVLIVLIGCLLGYPVFKRWYYRRLLKMKPKVE